MVIRRYFITLIEIGIEKKFFRNVRINISNQGMVTSLYLIIVIIDIDIDIRFRKKIDNVRYCYYITADLRISGYNLNEEFFFSGLKHECIYFTDVIKTFTSHFRI
jgi:hypothetical protein